MSNCQFFSKLVLGCLLIFSSLVFVPFLEYSYSSSDDVDVGKITRGSTISSNDTSPYWLSPSGNIAFGFYQLPWSPDQYDVGIWFAKSSSKTLVWSANHILPLQTPSSIIFTKEGKLVLRILPDNKDTSLVPDAAGRASYAKLHDNGNFVLYGSESQIVWESFDHPTDTILGGQKLKLGVDHLISNSGTYKLSMSTSKQVAIINNVHGYTTATIFSEDHGLPATLNLDTTGMLYLAEPNGAIRKVIYEEDKKQHNNLKQDGTSGYIYRATLNSGGDFILYKERIDGNCADSLVLLWASYQWSTTEKVIVSIAVPLAVLMILGLVGLVVFIAMEDTKKVSNHQSKK